jgi:hypothetical protein
MSDGGNSGQAWRSAWAVFLGFVVVVVLSLGTDLLLHVTGFYPELGKAMSNGLFALAMVYRTVYGILGSYITARFAPSNPIKHSMIGGVIGFVLSIGGVVETWNKPEMGPHWYPLALVVLAMPGAWLGGKIWIGSGGK